MEKDDTKTNTVMKESDKSKEAGKPLAVKGIKGLSGGNKLKSSLKGLEKMKA